jgi:hypothetical protein
MKDSMFQHRISWKRRARWPVGVALALFALLAGCGTFEDTSTPPEIIGRWITDTRGYQECFMVISENTINFYTLEGTFDVNFIDKVVRTEKKGEKVYEIHYRNRKDLEFVLSVVVLQGGRKGKLQFFNQKYLMWNKAEWEKE